MTAARSRRPAPGGRVVNPGDYPTDPCAYATEVLGVTWWAKQQEVARAVVKYPRVFVKASHGGGKTHLAGGLVSWHVESFNRSVRPTPAPTAARVQGLTR